MKSTFALVCLVLLPLFSKPQNPRPATQNTADSELQAVLSQMDNASGGFRSAQADFDWDNYQKVVDETEKQKGRVYFRRNGNDVEAMFDITTPVPKQVLFKGGKIQLYNPKIDQITEYEPGKNKSDVEAFLSLGFGARGHDLLKSYDVKMDGWEAIDGVRTAKLELVAKSEKVRNMFNKFTLSIDPKQDVPLKQQVFEPSGDYWLSHYTNIKLNARISDDVFRIKTTPRTRVVKPQ
ncbi:MAG TPA: outer-membrane lipoprotein carrier protein LolA [Candidatus Angelobacter sp.]